MLTPSWRIFSWLWNQISCSSLILSIWWVADITTSIYQESYTWWQQHLQFTQGISNIAGIKNISFRSIKVIFPKKKCNLELFGLKCCVAKFMACALWCADLTQIWPILRNEIRTETWCRTAQNQTSLNNFRCKSLIYTWATSPAQIKCLCPTERHKTQFWSDSELQNT